MYLIGRDFWHHPYPPVFLHVIDTNDLVVDSSYIIEKKALTHAVSVVMKTDIIMAFCT